YGEPTVSVHPLALTDRNTAPSPGATADLDASGVAACGPAVFGRLFQSTHLKRRPWALPLLLGIEDFPAITHRPLQASLAACHFARHIAATPSNWPPGWICTLRLAQRLTSCDPSQSRPVTSHQHLTARQTLKASQGTPRREETLNGRE